MQFHVEVINLCLWLLLVVKLVITEPVGGALTKVNCVETYGYFGRLATLRCAYEPRLTFLAATVWSKSGNTVYTYVANNPHLTKPCGEFATRNVTTKTDTSLGYHDMDIHISILRDEDTYSCTIIPNGGVSVRGECPKVTLRVPPARFELAYLQDGNFITVPDRYTDCATGGFTIYTKGNVMLRYMTASRPSSNITWNQSTAGTCVHKLLGDNTTQITFVGNLTVQPGQVKKVKFTLLSQNPDFKAGPLIKEACITIRKEGTTTEPPTSGEPTIQATTPSATPTPPWTWKTLLYRLLHTFHQGTYTETHMSSCASLPVILWHILLLQLGYVYSMTDM